MKPTDALVLGVAILMGILFLYYCASYRKPEIVQREVTEFIPAAAWLRAGIFFCLFHIISWATGVMETVINLPVATSEQLGDTRWWIWVVGLTAFILFAYWGIWAYYTIRFGIGGTSPRVFSPQDRLKGSLTVEGYMPGKRVVILGSGDIGMIMARRLTLEGAEVRAVAEMLPYPGGLMRNVVQCLNDFDIPLLLSHTVDEIHGDRRVEGVTLIRVDPRGEPVKGSEIPIECDTLLLSVGLIPENELSRMAGIRIDERTGGPIVNDYFETGIPGIFSCGTVLHVNDLVDNVSAEGDAAAFGAYHHIHGKLPREKKRISLETD